MTADHQMGPILRSWLKDTTVAPPNAQNSVSQVMDRLPQASSQRRWRLPSFRTSAPTPPTTDQTIVYQPSPIPATNGYSPTVLGRTQSMLSPVKAITAGAVVFALGGVLLIAQPFDRQGAAVPGAATDDPVMAPSFFTGSIGPGMWTTFGDESSVVREDGVIVIEGPGWGDISFNTNDPRITGTARLLMTEEDYREGILDDSPTGEVGAVRTGLFSIDNEGGSWSGTVANLQLENPTWEIHSAWLTGDGDYEGLMAYIVIEDVRGIHGFITPSGPPLAPEGFPE